MKLLIIRHGEPDYSIDSLTETGWKEAELLSLRISRLDVAAFYCSPLGRAKDTAAATLKAMGREAEILPWLREFPPLVQRPDRANSVAWDWMPGDWTPRGYFYDKDHWLDAPRNSGSQRGGGIPLRYRTTGWTFGCPRLLPGGTALQSGASEPGYSGFLLPFWAGMRPAEPSAQHQPHAVVAWDLRRADLRDHPYHRGAAKGNCLLPHEQLRRYLPPVCRRPAHLPRRTLSGSVLILPCTAEPAPIWILQVS